MTMKEDVSLAEYTTFKIGGIAKFFLQPTSIDDILSALQFLHEKQIPYFLLGGGSNVLLGSRKYDGGVISTLKLDKITLEGSCIRAEGGVINSDLSLFACQNNIQGFEFLFRLPGSVGGSTLMNARAFESSMSDIILEVTTIDSSLKLKKWSTNEINFDYKKSVFQNRDEIIVEVLFKADKGNSEKIKEKMAANEKKRLATKQYEYPSAGCVFKNNYDVGIPTGKIIDELGLKGKNVGDAEIYQQHGNFIINKGQANSTDVLKLIDYIKEKVHAEKDIDLECEIKFHGSF